MYESGSNAAAARCDSTESKPAVSGTDAHGGSSGSSRPGTVERLSRYGIQVMPSAFQRRSRLQRQQETPGGSAAQKEASITPAMRKKYLKELLLNASHGGFSGVLSSSATAAGDPRREEDSDWALYPMEHAWMLSAVEGNYETILEFVSEDPHLLSRRDFVSGYSVLHWLAKRGQDETLIKLLRYAEGAGIPVNVNLRGSGGLTPLHLASMHGQYMVIKLLVGAFGANVDAMDYSGRRAWQYLRGDAPLEMKELLGTWDDEHCGGCVPIIKNVNNNSSGSSGGAMNSTPYEDDEEDERDGEVEDEGYLNRLTRAGNWKFASVRKLFNSLPFVGYKT